MHAALGGVAERQSSSKGNRTPALASRLSNLQVTPALCVLALVSADQEKLEKGCRTLSYSDHACARRWTHKAEV